MAHLNPNIRKCARGEGEREASRQGRRLFSGTPFAMRRGRAARPISRRIPSLHAIKPVSIHAMKPLPSAPLCRYCAQIDPFLYSGVQNVVPIDGAIRTNFFMAPLPSR